LQRRQAAQAGGRANPSQHAGRPDIPALERQLEGIAKLAAALTKGEEYERARRQRAKFAARNGYYVERIAILKELDETGG
jgi:hypothetical protein